MDMAYNSFDSVEILKEVMQASSSHGTTRELSRGDTVTLQPTASGMVDICKVAVGQRFIEYVYRI